MEVIVDSDILFKWTDCCRLCLSNNVEFDLFDPKHDSKCKTLIFNLDLLIYRGDPMPRKLCLDCWGKVESWQEFRAQCVETETRLRKRLLAFRGLDFVQEYISKDNAMKDNVKRKSPGSSAQNENAKDEFLHELADSTMHFIGMPFKTEPKDPDEIVTTNDSTEGVNGENVESQECATSTAKAIPKPKIKVRTNLGYNNDDASAAEKDHEEIIPICSTDPTVMDILPVKGENNAMWYVTANMPVEDVDMTEFKVEPMSPELLGNSRGYNLRPRVETDSEDVSLANAVSQKITPWKCTACQIYFTSKGSVRIHQSSEECKGHSMENFPCHLCSKLYFDERDLAEHNIYHLKIAHNLTTDELRPCPKCNARFADQQRFSVHLKQHIRKIPSPGIQYACCGQTFSNKNRLDEHILTHKASVVNPIIEERDYACSLCIERFKSEDLLYDHRFAMHGIPDERVVCTHCLKKFRSGDALETHMSTHQTRSVARKSTSSQMPMNTSRGCKCRRCGKTFISNEQLKRHDAQKHKALHSCLKCKRRFATRSLLLMHHRTHKTKVTRTPTAEYKIASDGSSNIAGPDPKQVESMMVCSMCDLIFQCKEDISLHIETHYVPGNCPGRIRHLIDREYRFQCSHCPQLFLELSSSYRHSQFRHYGMRVEFIAMQFSAKRAGLGLATFDNQPSAPETIYPCLQCNAEFSSMAVLNFHLKKKHKGDETENEATYSTCRICSKEYARSYLNKHMVNDHGIQEPKAKLKRKNRSSNCYVFSKKKLLKCKYCPKTCSTVYNLEKHESSHDPASGSFKCHCGEKFNEQFLLYVHKKKCSKKKMLSEASSSTETCNICFQSYETPQLLQLHVSTAHGVGVPSEIPAKELWREERNKIIRKVNGLMRCTLCRVRFENSEEVSWHQGQHARGNAYIIQLDECLFQCTVCGKLFKQREDGMSHISTHAEPDAVLRPVEYSCPFCNDKFSTEDGIRGHIHSKHPNTT